MTLIYFIFLFPLQELEHPKSVLQQHKDAAGKRRTTAPLSEGLEGKAESLRAQTELQRGPRTVTKHICPLRPHPRCESHPLALHFQPDLARTQARSLQLLGRPGRHVVVSWPNYFHQAFTPALIFSLLVPQRASSSAVSGLCRGLSLTCPSASRVGRAAL